MRTRTISLPRPIAEKFNAALAQAVRDPANRKQLIGQSADPVGSSIDEHPEKYKWRSSENAAMRTD